MKILNRKLMTGVALSAIVWSVATVPVLAQIEEIVVTAQKREQNINDIGISVTAFSSAAIRNLGIEEAFDIATYTPGLNMVASSGYSGKINFTLRGVGLNNFAESQEAAVAIYHDEIYLAPLIGSVVGIFDLERIEVLRGPQGTLFGRSATGGLVHYISKRPSNDFEGYVGVQYGSYNERRGELAVGGPLVEDKVAVRISGYWNKYDGWLNNLNGPDQYAEERYAVRGQVLFTPTDNFELLLKAEYGELGNKDGVAYLSQNAFQDPADNVIKDLPAALDAHFTGPGNDFTGFRDTDGEFLTGSWDVRDDLRNDVERTLLSAILTWDMGPVTLTSVTSYLEAKKDYFDSNESNPTDFFHLGQLVDSEQFIQELRFSGSADNMRWTVGGFYFNYDVFNNLSFDLPSGFAPPFGGFFALPVILDNLTNQSKESIAGFGQIEYDLSDQFTIIAGARYEREKVNFDYFQAFALNPDVLTAFLGAPFVFNETLNGDFAVIDKNYFSGNLELDWRPSDDTLIYVSARRGIKPGAFNTPFAFLPEKEMKVKEEKLHAFEVGTKLTLFNGRMQVNGAAFYYDYKDYQAVSLKGPSAILTNVNATLYGLDLEVLANPIEGLDLGIGLSLIRGKAKDIGFLAPGGPVIRDREVPNAPKYSVTAMARYEWPVFNGLMALQGDAQFQDGTFFDIQNHPANTSDARGIGNLRVSWSQDGFEFAAFVKNVWNEEYVAFVEDNVDFGGYKVITPGKPRWWGVELRYAWGG